MRYLRKYKMFENKETFDKIKMLCNTALIYLKDDDFYYYVGESNNGDTLIEVYKRVQNEIFYWDSVKDEILSLIILLNEEKHEVIEILFEGDKFLSVTPEKLLSEYNVNNKIENIVEIKIYIKNENT